MTAFAGAAQAQSSVSVYGIMDLGYVGSNAQTYGSTSPNLNSKVTVNQITAGAESTSRLGFKGTEDLGGGTSAIFTIELGLNPQNPQLTGTSAASMAYDQQGTSNAGGATVDNRQSFVGLQKKGVGAVMIGRQYTTMFDQVAATSPNGMNQVFGDAIYVGASTQASQGSGMYYLEGFTNRASNAIKFDSDPFAGARAHAFYALNTTNTAVTTTSTGGNSNWGGFGLSLDYTLSKFYATAAYQSFKTAQSYGSTVASVQLGGNGCTDLSCQYQTPGTAAMTASNLSDKQAYFAATYDFGILKAFAQYVNRNVYQNYSETAVANSSTTGAGQVFRRDAKQIGIRSYVTPSIEAWASAGMGSYTGIAIAAANGAAPGAQLATATANKFTSYQLGANYYLSKRTNLYGIFGAAQTTSNTTGNIGSGTAANNYAVGIRHTF
jgi:predicted porin